MNREIKFRACYKGEMFAHVEHTTFSDGSNGVTALANGILFSPNSNEVTLMQFTGLKDKNGKEIYEGDVVRIQTPKNQIQRKSIISEIGFYESAFCAYWRATEIWEGYSVSPSSVYYLNCLIDSDQIEVIGNIYENPELIKL